MSVRLTNHAKKRLKERSGLNKRSMYRIAERAYNNGIGYEDTKGEVHRWLKTKCGINRKLNNVRIYGDKLFLFRGECLITVLQIPNSLKNKIYNQML